MSVSRRRFFKGLVGGLGSLGLANVLLSKQGWLGFFQHAKAHADIPPPYNTYALKPQFYFFEGKRNRDAPIPQQDALGQNFTPLEKSAIQAFTDVGPWIIEYSPPDPAAARHIVKIYDLTSSAAFITKLLLMGVDTSTLSQMYVSRFGAKATGTQPPTQFALITIDNFINNSGFFQTQTYPIQDLNLSQTESYRYPGTGPKKKIWADFSMGGVTYAGVIKYP